MSARLLPRPVAIRAVPTLPPVRPTALAAVALTSIRAIVLGPVPAEIVAVAPETAGYEYFSLPDGRIVLVHPAERTIATIIE